MKITKKDNTLTYIDGVWGGKIHADETNWTIEDEEGQKMMMIYLTKWNQSMVWWDKLIEGETPIDT